MNNNLVTNTTMSQGRLSYLDIAKTLGMLFIIWGHIYIGTSTTFVYAFHIPLFFFLSGMVFNKNKYPQVGPFIKRRVNTLLVPYVFYSVLTWIIWVAYTYAFHVQVDSIWKPLLETLIAQGSEGYLVHNVPLWFVTCLFVVELLYYYISKLSDLLNILICVILAVVSYVLVNYCSFFDFTKLPWNIEVALMALPFYSLGNLTVKRLAHDKIMQLGKGKKGWLALFISISLFVLVYILAPTIGMASMGHAFLTKNPCLFYVYAIMGVVATLMLSVLISQTIFNEGKFMQAFRWFGRNSFDAMGIHNPIKGFLIVILAQLFGLSQAVFCRNVGYSLLAFIGTLVATSIWMLLINKIRAIVKKSK